MVNNELCINFSMHILLENGANIKDIQNRLDHSKLTTTMDTYSHVTDKMKNNTVFIFDNIAKNLPPI